MTTKTRRFWRGNKRFRLMLTLELAVMLPAAALIYVNFHHLKEIKRDKNVEATIHRDFQYMLSASEKKINDKFYTMTEEIRDVFPFSDTDTELDKGRTLEIILSKNPSLGRITPICTPRSPKLRRCTVAYAHLVWSGMVALKLPARLSPPAICPVTSSPWRKLVKV
jgi:hypothetical protein